MIMHISTYILFYHLSIQHMRPGSTGDARKAALAALVNCRNPPVQQPVPQPAFLGCDLKMNAGVISDCLEMLGKCVCLQ